MAGREDGLRRLDRAFALDPIERGGVRVEHIDLDPVSPVIALILHRDLL